MRNQGLRPARKAILVDPEKGIREVGIVEELRERRSKGQKIFRLPRGQTFRLVDIPTTNGVESRFVRVWDYQQPRGRAIITRAEMPLWQLFIREYVCNTEEDARRLIETDGVTSDWWARSYVCRDPDRMVRIAFQRFAFQRFILQRPFTFVPVFWQDANPAYKG